MKKILLSLSFIIVLCFSVNSQTIGIVRNAQYRITADMRPIKARWEQLLVEQNNAAILSDFTIKSGADKVTGKTYYMLIATNRGKTVRIAELLKQKVNGDLIFMPKTESAIGTVICSGCSVGCAPEILDNVWICNPDCPTPDKPCIKLVKATIP